MIGGGVRAFSFVQIEVFVFLLTVCTLGTLAVSEQQNPSFYTQGRYGKRGESYAQPTSFFSGSRYGRGGTTHSTGLKPNAGLLAVPPRVDRFYFGSRYGKRALGDANYTFRPQERQFAARNSLLKRYEQALGYFDRLERTDRIGNTIHNSHDRTSSDKMGKSTDENEEIPMDISIEKKLDEIW